MRPALLAASILLAAPAAAPAGEVSATQDSFYGHRVTWTADPGASNDLRISYAGQAVLLEDAGAAVRAGAGCEQVSEHLARCPVPQFGTPKLTGQAGDGPDVVTASGLNVTLDGGPGDDRLTAGPGPEFGYETRLIGGDGNDLLTGGPSHDAISGGRGTDTLIGGDGRDHFFGEHEDGDVSTDVVDGGSDIDSVSYFDRTEPVVVDLHAQQSGQAGELDRLTSVESASGGSGDDRLIAHDDYGFQSGNGGDDVITGTPGPESLTGGDGDDRIDAGAGDDKVYGDAGADRLVAGDGDDVVYGGQIPEIRGEGGDRIDAGSGNDAVYSVSRVVCGRGRDGVFGQPVRRPIPRDCEATDFGRGGVTLSPVRITARSVVFTAYVGHAGARVSGATLRRGATVLGRTEARRLPTGGRVRWRFRLTRAGRRAAADGTMQATLRVGGADRFTAVLRRG